MEFLTVLLFGLSVFGGVLAGPACDPAPASENLALKGTASQSTQYGYLGLPSYPLSGKRTGNYHDMSCSATNGDLNPWWKVDLGKSQAIGSVVVVNRADCCPERLTGAEVRVGDNENNNNPVCGAITDLSAGFVSTLCCKGMVGRYVSVVIPGRQEYLTLCGVEVYGWWRRSRSHRRRSRMSAGTGTKLFKVHRTKSRPNRHRKIKSPLRMCDGQPPYQCTLDRIISKWMQGCRGAIKPSGFFSGCSK